MTRLGVEMLPKTLPGARISSRLQAGMSPVTLPSTTTNVPLICALTTPPSRFAMASCAASSPPTWPSIGTVPSKPPLRLPRLPLPRAAWGVRRDPHARAEPPCELLGEPTQVEVAGTARGRAFPLTVPPRGRQALRVALAEAARHDLAREAHLLRHPLDREHGARVARRQLPALELGLDRVREAEQAQRVRDRRAALPHPLGQLVLREPALVDQVAVRLGLLERGQVLALHVLDQRELEAVLGPRLAHDHRDPLEPGAQRRPQPPLAGDQLVASRDAARDQGLEEPVAADRVGEEPERLVVEVPARLLRVGYDLVDRHRELARRRGGDPPVRRRRKERLDALPECLPHPALHSAFLSTPHGHRHASASWGMGSASAGAAISRASARYATAPRDSGS